MSEDEHSAAPLTLPTTSVAARLARRHVAMIVASWPADVRDLALLLTSELVTNALRYGNGAIRLSVRQTPHALRVEVHDANPEAPRLSRNLDGTAEQGRGLHIVDSLATCWGHTPSADPAGKTVWFELHDRPTDPDGHSD